MLQVSIICLLFTTVWAVRFQFLNNEGTDLWIGIQGNAGKPTPSGGGFQLNPGQRSSIEFPPNWAGRFWARTWCDEDSEHCLTGDCGNVLECAGSGPASPVTSAEITLKGLEGLDYYYISLVNGFNIPASIEPVGGEGDGSQYSCKKTACAHHINDECLQELKLSTSHGVIGCNSACSAFNTDLYCCQGVYNTPETCNSLDWPVNYPHFFKTMCPDAYSYAYDDDKTTFTCRAETYTITFGIEN